MHSENLLTANQHQDEKTEGNSAGPTTFLFHK